MSVRQTSMDAFIGIRDEGLLGEQALTILKHIKKFNFGWTRNELKRELGIEVNAISGRVNQLLKDGWLEEKGTREDVYTHKKNLILYYRVQE